MITPEGCAAILWKDRAFSAKAAAALNLTGTDLLKLGIIDGIVPEPMGGAHKDCDKAAKILGDTIAKELGGLSKLSSEELMEQRYNRFRSIEFFKENADAGKDAGGNGNA